MSGVEPGWYPDPAAPETQRYWDGEQWLGAPLPVDAPTPATPPAPEPEPLSPSAPDPATAPDSGPQAILPQYPRVPTTFPTRPPQQDQPPGYGGPGGSPAFPPPGQYSPRPPAFPQQPPPPGFSPQQSGVQLAPLSARFGARLIDLLMLMVLNVVVNGYFFVRYYQESAPVIEDAMKSGRSLFEIAIPAEAQRLNLIMVAVSFVLWFLYEVPSTARWGQTLGKRVLGIRVTMMDGTNVRFMRTIRRWFLLTFPTLFGACGWPIVLINVLWCVWDRPAQQCLHDKAARTIVVVAQPQPKPPQQPPTGPWAARADVKDDHQARLD
jgi:uncharacterized RDD family membrane protein YckC